MKPKMGSTNPARPQAKTAARKAFEREYGVRLLPYPGYEEKWAAFHSGWRAARGCKPTTREGAT